MLVSQNKEQNRQNDDNCCATGDDERRRRLFLGLLLGLGFVGQHGPACGQGLGCTLGFLDLDGGLGLLCVELTLTGMFERVDPDSHVT